MKLANGYWIVADRFMPKHKKPGKWDWLLRLIPPLFRRIEAKRPWVYSCFTLERVKTMCEVSEEAAATGDRAMVSSVLEACQEV